MMTSTLAVLAVLAKNRLVQFVAIGGLLFAVDAVRHPKETPPPPRPREAADRAIDLDPVNLTELRAAQAKKLGLASLPEPAKREVDARAIEDEILYREALRLGLDKDDPILRQRLIQKLLFIVEDLGGASKNPSEAELRAYFESTRERWRTQTEWHFVHVFARERDKLPSFDSIAAADPSAVQRLGEAFPYPRQMTLTKASAEQLFGADFTTQLVAMKDEDVSEQPLRSPFGWHRVKVVKRIEGRPAKFEDVQGSIALDFLLGRRERVVGSYLVNTAATYDVRIGGAPVVDFVPTRRVADRNEGSAED